jgi:alkanesulfonate monooxygenase SsuD/methylene tetrahydromethanopterin reductase-like flavin-dependent oxidoreductase (luciferase family)
MLSKQERRTHLAEAIAALKALFEGRPWEGGEHVPAMAGPLLPRAPSPGGPPIWIGAQADEVVALAGQLADGWNGWGLRPPEFARKAKLLAEEAGAAGREAEATWACIVLVGEDDADAERLVAGRRARGTPDDGLWWGSAERFVELLESLGDAGASWAVLVPAGPPDRIDLIAERVLQPGRGSGANGGQS